MKINQVTEIGIVVRDLDRSIELFVDLLGAEAGEIITMEFYQMRYCMCRLGKVDFELMEPMGDVGATSDFLKSRGEGLHHVAFSVDDIVDGVDELKAKGIRFVEEKPYEVHHEHLDMIGKRVSGITRMTFGHPKSFHGVLFEFIQYPEDFRLS